MNWKKGFFRITLIISVLILLIGAGITASTVSGIYANYRYYNSAAFQQVPPRVAPDTAFDPDAYLAKRHIRYLDEIPHKYEPEILPTILWGALFSILAAAFPWAVFGLGLYLVRGFRNSN